MNFLRCFAISLLISVLCCFCAVQCASTTATTKAPPPSTNSTTNTTTTKPPESTNTTTTAAAPTTTTTTAATTTTLATTTTAEPAAILGADCSSRDPAWCQKYISGSVTCAAGVCSCDTSSFQRNDTTCLPDTKLTPIINNTSPTITTTSIQISWSVEPEVSGLTLFYNVTCSSVRSGKFRSFTARTVRNVTCDQLNEGDQYDIEVVTYFTQTNGDVASQTATTTFSTNPAQPGQLNLTASDLSAPDITLRWGASPGFVDRYKIQITGHDGDLYTTGNETEIPVTGLESGRQYEIRISAESYGRTGLGRVENITTDSEPPGPPEGLAFSTKDKTSVTVTWNETTKPNGVLTGYLVCYRERVYSDEAFSPLTCSQIPKSTQHAFQPLKPGGYYEFEIFSVNADYNGTQSANLTGIRTEEDVPGKVVGLSIEVNNLTFHVTWQRPSEPKGDIIKYVIDWSRDDLQCSDCLTIDGVNCSVQTMQNCSSSSGNHIVMNQNDLNYTITGLSPFTNYTVTVTPYTSEGPGANDSKTTRTSVVEPDPVTNVVATALNSTSVMVSWTIPAKNPGPVNYTVLSDDRIRMTDPKAIPGCSAEGYETPSCIVTGLEEYWVYQFHVIASTEAGDSLPTPSTNTTTLEGVPAAVQEWTVTLYDSPANCDATRVRYNWIEPRLTDRNAKIVEYIISDTTQNTAGVRFTVENPDPYRSTDRAFSKVITHLTANTLYNRKMEAFTDGGQIGESFPKSFTTSTCAPPGWPDSASIDEMSGKKTTASFTVTLQRNFFVNNLQGEIKETGLIISKQNYSIEVKSAKQNTWSSAKEGDFERLYAVRFVVPNTNIFEVIVGQNTTCSDDKKDTTYCNGQLPSSREFYVMAYACTDANKCTGSPFYGAYGTADPPVEEPPSSSPAGAIAGALIGVGVVVFVVALVIMQRRGTIDLKKCLPGRDDGRYLPPDPPPETKRPVRFSAFENYVQELHKDTNLLFSCQYEDIQKYSKSLYDTYTTDNANLEENKAKNRWVNILPFDHSRVKLQPLDDDDPTSDYINANYIPGVQHQRDYIATQGPLPGTIDDFWRMVWEHNIAVIVMLTQCKEGNRVKCEPYWPNEIHEPKQYGEVVVDPVSISTLGKYNITIFNVSVNDIKRTVYHFHYLEFPDMSANVEYDVFLEFLKVVRSHIPRNIDSPIVVHCSAGVGRTGTFIILDRLQQTLSRRDFKWENTVDILDMVIGMRHNRTNMVQTESQYIMIHDCLCKMLENKKRSTDLSLEDENLYVNQAYDPSPEVLYENLKGNDMKTDL